MKIYQKTAVVALSCAVAQLAKAQINQDNQTFSVSEIAAQVVVSNPEIAFYKEAITGANFDKSFAAKFNDPELSFDVGYKRNREGRDVENGAVWQVSVMQTFEWPGRISLRKAIAQKNVELAEMGLAQFKNALSARAKLLAFGLYSANEKSAAIAEVAERYKALRETFLQREPSGISPLMQTRVIEAAEISLNRSAADAKLAVENALIELNLLRGAKVNSPVKVRAEAVDFKELPPLEELLSAAEKFNYDYRTKIAELEQQGYVVELSRNERYPSISAGPYVSMDKVGGNETIIGLSVSMPLPITGRQTALSNSALSKKRQAETAVMLAHRELNRRVISAAKIYETKLADLKRWKTNSVEKFREASELADRHFRMGAIDIAVYVEVQNSYLSAVESLLNTESEILAAAFELQELTGVDLTPAQRNGK